MAPKKGAPVPKTTSKGRSKKSKGETQPKTPMQRVAVMGPSGKVRFEWREWSN